MAGLLPSHRYEQKESQVRRRVAVVSIFLGALIAVLLTIQAYLSFGADYLWVSLFLVFDGLVLGLYVLIRWIVRRLKGNDG